jgi:hypothetical protein
MRLYSRAYALLTLLIVLMTAACISAQAEAGFVSLFDGKTLDGWTLVGGAGPGYVPQDGVLWVPSDGGGNLYTNNEYRDFIFRFDFKTDPEGNNGIGIRSPLEGGAAYNAMEIQVLDDSHPSYANLEPGQYCGSIYKVAPAKRGSLKPAGQWNSEEITAIGRHITIKINGKVVVNADLNKITDPHILAEHPGMLRDHGHVGFLGHGPSAVWFRNIRIKDLSKPEKDNTPPPGFTALFNGKDLTGWKGLVKNPPERHKMAAAELQAAEAAATVEALKHWQAVDGAITYDGKNDSLCTAKQYADFEMLVDWKIEPGGDSGIYLRGSPQVQIWDTPIGSGGLYNNQKNPSNPTVKADNAPGQWNRFRIMMVGDKVTVILNEKVIVNSVTMENYWERDKPIYPIEQIELQHHGSKLEFKNIYIREIKPEPAK